MASLKRFVPPILVLGVFLVAGCGSGDGDAAAADPGPAAVDAGAGDAGAPDPGEPADVVADAVDDPGASDTGEHDIHLSFDPGYDLVVRAPDTSTLATDVFGTCPALGISERWTGEFRGIVRYQTDAELAGVPKQAFYLVDGDMNFEIQCIQQKFVVAGEMNGIAEAAEYEGEHPYVGQIVGDYNPITRSIDARLVNGEVRVYKIVSFFFEGEFPGEVNLDNRFVGTWDIVHTGNDLNIEADASGRGEWETGPDLSIPEE